MRVKYTKSLYFRVYISFCVNLVIFLGKMTKMVNNVQFSCEFGNLSKKDDENGE